MFDANYGGGDEGPCPSDALWGKIGSTAARTFRHVIPHVFHDLLPGGFVGSLFACSYTDECNNRTYPWDATDPAVTWDHTTRARMAGLELVGRFTLDGFKRAYSVLEKKGAARIVPVFGYAPVVFSLSTRCVPPDLAMMGLLHTHLNLGGSLAYLDHLAEGSHYWKILREHP